MKYAECPFCQKSSTVGDDGNLNRSCHHAIMTYVDSGWMKSDGPTMIRFSFPDRSVDEDIECWDDDDDGELMELMVAGLDYEGCERLEGLCLERRRIIRSEASRS